MIKNTLNKIKNFFHNQYFTEDAYLNEAVDMIDLEHRMRELENKNGFWIIRNGY